MEPNTRGTVLPKRRKAETTLISISQMSQKLINVMNGSGTGTSTAIPELIQLVKLNFRMDNMTRLQVLPSRHPLSPSTNIRTSILAIQDIFRIPL